MQSLDQNVYNEVLQTWNGNTQSDDFGVGCELFAAMLPLAGDLEQEKQQQYCYKPYRTLRNY